MNDTEAFLRKIRENPDDDAPRLVFADYLDEQAQKSSNKEAKEQAKWAALIRAQIAEVRESHADVSLWNKWAGVNTQDRITLALKDIPSPVLAIYDPTLDRGFYDNLGCTISEFDSISSLLENSVVPMRSVCFHGGSGQWSDIADNPTLSLFREIQLECRLSETDFEQFCNDPQLQKLSKLEIVDVNLPKKTLLEQFAKAKSLTSIRELHFPMIDSISAFSKLLSLPIAARLEKFGEGFCDIQQLYQMSKAPLAQTLTNLSFWVHSKDSLRKKDWGTFSELRTVEISNAASGEQLIPFLETQNWERIQKLILSGEMPDDVLSYFDDSEGELELYLPRMKQPELKKILTSPRMNRVKKLVLSGRATESALVMLSKNESITNLRSLEVSDFDNMRKPIPFFSTLCQSPVFANLLHLKIDDHILSLATLKKMADSPLGQSLRGLHLDRPREVGKTAAFFRDSKNFPNLVYLSNTWNSLDSNLFWLGRTDFSFP